MGPVSATRTATQSCSTIATSRTGKPERETMTTLENRPKTALLVVDVQNGVVEGAPERDTVVANVGSLVEKARREQGPVVWVQHSHEGPWKGEGRLGDRPRAEPGRGRAARREELRRLLRGHRPRDRAIGPRRRTT